MTLAQQRIREGRFLAVARMRIGVVVEFVPGIRQAMSLRSNEIVQLRKKTYGLCDDEVTRTAIAGWIALTLEPCLWML